MILARNADVMYVLATAGCDPLFLLVAGLIDSLHRTLAPIGCCAANLFPGRAIRNDCGE